MQKETEECLPEKILKANKIGIKLGIDKNKQTNKQNQ